MPDRPVRHGARERAPDVVSQAHSGAHNGPVVQTRDVENLHVGGNYHPPSRAGLALGAVAVLVAALAVYLLLSAEDRNPGPVNGSPSPSPAPASTPAPTGRVSSSAPTPNPDGTVSWSGDFALTGGTSIDLDRDPPLVGGTGADVGKLDYNDVNPGPGALLAEWPGPGEPSFQDCLSEVGQMVDYNAIGVAVGRHVCVRTDENRIARVTVRGIQDGGRFGFSATVWG